jgi:hypothetical protein
VVLKDRHHIRQTPILGIADHTAAVPAAVDAHKDQALAQS